MNFFKTYKFESNLLFHGLLGAICSILPVLVIPWILIVIGYFGTIKVYATKNKYGDAHFVAAYIAGFEILGRMARVGLPHELTKYAVIFVLLNGVIASPRHPSKSGVFILFFILLTPSLIFLANLDTIEQARQYASFNLTGPLCLAVSGYYFYRRLLDKAAIIRLFQNIILPLASILVWLFIRTPSLKDIEFTSSANFITSGYGPNQMASVLGLGVLLIGIAYLFKIELFKNKLFGYFMLLLLIYRGVLTFSRGGMLAPVLILMFVLFYFFFSYKSFKQRFGNTVLTLFLLGIIAFSSYSYINSISKNALENRYIGVNYGKRVTLEKYTSGRLEILKIDFNIFKDNPFLGIGPGMGNDMRVEYGYYERTAAHIEFSRLLAEHGLLGLLAMLILIGFPLVEFKYRKALESKLLMIIGVLFCFTFMLHSATRLALPMFMYGLGFIIYDHRYNSIRKITPRVIRYNLK